MSKFSIASSKIKFKMPTYGNAYLIAGFHMSFVEGVVVEDILKKLGSSEHAFPLAILRFSQGENKSLRPKKRSLLHLYFSTSHWCNYKINDFINCVIVVCKGSGITLKLCAVRMHRGVKHINNSKKPSNTHISRSIIVSNYVQLFNIIYLVSRS